MTVLSLDNDYSLLDMWRKYGYSEDEKELHTILYSVVETMEMKKISEVIKMASTKIVRFKGTHNYSEVPAGALWRLD